MEADFDTSGLMTEFRDDAFRHIDVIEECLLFAEQTALFDPEKLRDAMGSLHTLKGNSGMMGFENIQTFVHSLEEIFRKITDGQVSMNAASMNVLFECLTALRASIENPGEDRCAQFAQLQNDIQQHINQQAVPVEEQKKQELTPSVQHAENNHISSTIRVDFERLDQLMNLAGELVVLKTKLNTLAKEADSLPATHILTKELPDTAQMIDKATSNLQEAIMRVRMLPIGHVFRKFPRLVRDLAQQTGKEIRFVTTGEDTEIDKSIIDIIGEPLIHLIRNAVDHGIEPAEIRKKAGKDPVGTLTLAARQESNQIIITLSDDGAGINSKKVREKAIEKGILTAEESVADDEIHNLIFHPGFSTADCISETSGRGVGMDVVRKVITDLSGVIEIHTNPASGTEFVLKLPLTLAIISVLLVTVAGQIFAIPAVSVEESIKIPLSQLHAADGREIADLRGAIVPVRRLHHVLGLSSQPKMQSYLVILRRAERRIGLLVDKVKGQMDVVIKPLGDYLKGINGISGSTISGDGSIVLVLDTTELLK